MKKLLSVGLILSVTVFVGCGGSSSGGGGTNPSTPSLVSISVSPSSASITPGATQQLTATGNYSDGSTKNLTSTANWTSSSAATASVSIAGLATGVAPGTATISAQSSGVTGTATVTVTNPLVSIAISPTTASVAPNGTQQYTATGTYADHSTQNIANSVGWSASMGATITAGGLATAITPNATVTIMATSGNISGTVTMTVTNPLVSIAVTPAAPQIAAGTTQQFVATGTYADHSTQVITPSVTWASSNTIVATISNSAGTQGIANGLTAGTTNITALLNGITSPADVLTVSSAILVSIAVTPATAQIVYPTQLQYTATGTYNDGTHQVITNLVTWTSSDTAHITITPTTGVATGVATTNTPVTITATLTPGTPGTATATVIPPAVTSITIAPTTPQLALYTSRGYVATATLTNGSTLNVTTQATWASTNTSAATVVNGLVAAQSVGTTVISATYNGVSSNFTLTVDNPAVQSVTVTPITATMPNGVSQRFHAVAAFSDGTSQDISANVAWSTSPTGVASVNPFGLATSLSVGSTTVTAAFPPIVNCGTSPTNCGSAGLTVDSSSLQSIAIGPPSTVLPPGRTINFGATGTYSDGLRFSLSGLSGVSWSSSAPGTVSIIANTGVATTENFGLANISVTYQGVTAAPPATAIVTNFPLVSIGISPATATVPFGVSTTFAATGTFSDGSKQVLTNYAAWAASPSSVANISNPPSVAGVATGIAPGTASITAVFSDISAPASTLTVTNATLTSITVTPNNSSANPGGQVSFTATGNFSDGSNINLTTQVTWVSTSPSVATVSTSGLVSAASAGTTSIQASFAQGGTTVTGLTNFTVN